MTQSSSSTPAQAKPVVQATAPAAHKIKIDGSKLAGLNAFSTAFAIFFGGLTLFSAIASLVEDWSFSLPFLTSNLGAKALDLVFGPGFLGLGLTFILGLFTLLFGVISIYTVYKVTDLNKVKAANKKVSVVMTVIAAIYGVSLVGIVVMSLMSLGSDFVDQKSLWLNGFVTNLIVFIFAAISAFFAHSIAQGKTNFLRTSAITAIAIAGTAFVLVFIAYLVGLHGDDGIGLTPYGYSKSSFGSSLEDLKDLFNY